MEKRRKELSELHDFIDEVDEKLKIILQNVKWDRKRLIEDAPKATCSYDKSHKLASDKVDYHERQCFLKSHSYDKDFLLPDPLYADANTLIKLDKQAIISIINNASCGNPLFKQGIRSQSPEPWTLERLQATYTTDERCALHDAVVQAVPSCHDLADLALPSTEDGTENPRVKSRAEILAELRDMKRRRAKYRVAAKTRKYSDVLRNVIKTQMELYTDTAHQTTANPDLNESVRQKDNHDKDLPLLKKEMSLRDNDGEHLQNENFSYNFRRINRNTEWRTERDSSFLRDGGGRQQRDYYSNSYAKNKDRMMSKKFIISSAEERGRYNPNDYSTSRYERKRGEKNNLPGENREKQPWNYSSSNFEKNKFREPTLPEDARENRRRHEYTDTSIRVYPNPFSYTNRSGYDENYDDQSRKRRKKDTSHDYSYTDRSRNRRREKSGSSDRDEIPSRRKHTETKSKHSRRTTREENTGRDGSIRVKSERDRTPDRDLSDCETRYDYVYTSCRPKRKRESSEENDHTTGNSRNRNEGSKIPIKTERETPGRESNEIDTQSHYTRTSTYISSRHNDSESSSESDNTTSKRGKKTKDYYKDSIKKGRREQTNVRVKKKRDESPKQESYHRHHKTKKNRKKHKHRSSKERDRSPRGRERESKDASRYSSYGNDRVGETRIRIKKEKDATPPDSPEYDKKDCQYASTNTIQERRDSNSSWE